MNVYDFSVRSAKGSTFSLEPFLGTVSLIVNTASQCAYAGQLDALDTLHKKYNQDGFSVLAFPSNQFHNQEPGSGTEIQQLYTNELNLSFPVFGKVLVNGPQADPLFQYLKSEIRYNAKSVIPQNMHEIYLEIDPYYLTSADIKWNFTKFLVDKNGKVVSRFEPEDLPENFEADIIGLLSQKFEPGNTTSEKRF